MVYGITYTTHTPTQSRRLGIGQTAPPAVEDMIEPLVYKRLRQRPSDLGFGNMNPATVPAGKVGKPLDWHQAAADKNTSFHLMAAL